MMECEERATNFTEEEIEEMFEYGIKPYDEDAWVSALYTCRGPRLTLGGRSKCFMFVKHSMDISESCVK